jgi:hypothetical protein
VQFGGWWVLSALSTACVGGFSWGNRLVDEE